MIVRIFAVCVSLFCTFLLSSAQPYKKIFNETCESKTVNATELNATVIDGSWYVIASYDNTTNCTEKMTITSNSNNSTNIISIQPEKQAAIDLTQQGNSTKIQSNDTSIGYIISSNYSSYGIIWLCSDSENSTSNQQLYVLSKNNASSLNSFDLASTWNSTNLHVDHLTEKSVCSPTPTPSGSATCLINILTIITVLLIKTGL